jgi:hypothetical protein
LFAAPDNSRRISRRAFVIASKEARSVETGHPSKLSRGDANRLFSPVAYILFFSESGSTHGETGRVRNLLLELFPPSLSRFDRRYSFHADASLTHLE